MQIRDAGAADGALLTDADADAGAELDCDGEYLVFDYMFDGVPGSTGCRAAEAGSWVASDSTGTAFGYDPEMPSEPTGLPAGVCGHGTYFYNIPLESGASGAVRYVDGPNPPDPSVPQVVSWTAFAWDGSVLHDSCEPGGWERVVMTGGTWHVLRGGVNPGDWVDVEARDVTFEPFGGHSFRFERMRWHVQLQEPVVLP